MHLQINTLKPLAGPGLLPLVTVQHIGIFASAYRPGCGRAHLKFAGSDVGHSLSSTARLFAERSPIRAPLAAMATGGSSSTDGAGAPPGGSGAGGGDDGDDDDVSFESLAGLAAILVQFDGPRAGFAIQVAISTALERLASPDAQENQKGIETFIKLEENGGYAVPSLIAALDGDEPKARENSFRIAAVMALYEIGLMLAPPRDMILEALERMAPAEANSFVRKLMENSIVDIRILGPDE